MKRNIYKLLGFSLALLACSSLMANNITVSNLSQTGKNTTDNYLMVQFDLSWENSWRTSSLPGNRDAAWIFVKYRVGSTGNWQHALLNNTGHSGGTGTSATIDPGLHSPDTPYNSTTNPALGIFVYRSANGTGTFSIIGAQLRWNYGDNGLADDAEVDIKVFAIEMVNAPMGAFYVGSGGAESGSFKNGTTSDPFLIRSEASIEIGNEDGKLWGSSTSGENTIGDAGTLAASFPKGYTSFYLMKYEISQQQYVDFLNTLSRVQQNNRTQTSLAAETTTVTNRYVMSDNSTMRYRNGIRCDATIPANDPITFYCDMNGNGTGGEAGDGQWIACNYLSWMDGAAYADWAGLRPMTELEFEKASRGTSATVANEYIWGTTDLLQVTGITNSGTTNETASNSGNGISVHGDHSSVKGPLRVGALASAGTTTRAASGSSYYGIKELGGNLWERPVTVGDADGRAYTGIHGNGALSTNGHANETGWPGLISGEVTVANGTGHRGGTWSMPATLMQTSDRNHAVSANINRDDYYGFRAARTGSFICGESKITDIDGNMYNTVKIGSQCWMKENLNVTKAPNGTVITRLCYDNSTANCATYGGLYNWDAIMNGAASSNSNPSGVQGICPNGWHLPSEAEWTQLVNYVSTTYLTAGGKLKTTYGWYQDGNGTDDFGFSALPSGRSENGLNFGFVTWAANFKSSTGNSTEVDNAWGVHLNSGGTVAYIDALIPKAWYNPVRCLKD